MADEAQAQAREAIERERRAVEGQRETLENADGLLKATAQQAIHFDSLLRELGAAQTALAVMRAEVETMEGAPGEAATAPAAARSGGRQRRMWREVRQVGRGATTWAPLVERQWQAEVAQSAEAVRAAERVADWVRADRAAQVRAAREARLRASGRATVTPTRPYAPGLGPPWVAAPFTAGGEGGRL